VVRAHPTVPILTPLNCRFSSNCFWSCRDICAVARGPPLLANPDTFTHNSVQFCRGDVLGERMSVFQARHFQLGLLLAAVLAVSISPAAAQGYTPEQEQACTGDAFRLCSAEIPDVGRVTACMDAKRSQLSPPCRAQFRPDEPDEAAARPVGRPTVIRPAAPRKAASTKARKAKKPAKPAS
jgi:hypothetical protein